MIFYRTKVNWRKLKKKIPNFLRKVKKFQLEWKFYLQINTFCEQRKIFCSTIVDTFTGAAVKCSRYHVKWDLRATIIFYYFNDFQVHEFHAETDSEEEEPDHEKAQKLKLAHALACMGIKPSNFHSLVVLDKYDLIEELLKKAHVTMNEIALKRKHGIKDMRHAEGTVF